MTESKEATTALDAIMHPDTAWVRAEAQAVSLEGLAMVMLEDAAMASKEAREARAKADAAKAAWVRTEPDEEWVKSTLAAESATGQPNPKAVLRAKEAAVVAKAWAEAAWATWEKADAEARK